MAMKDRIVAVVPSAGIGKRFGGKTRKTFVTLGGKPLIIWAIETLNAAPEVREIIPVIREDDMDYVLDLFEQYPISKIKRIAPGGRERQDSVYHGLNLIEDRKCIVLVHDGARPLLEPAVIGAAARQLKGCDGVVVGVPVKDTIKEAVEGEVRQTLARERLWQVQTPQVFPCETILEAYSRAMKESFYSTDDSALVEKYGGRIRMVMGSYTNIKVTTPEDLMIAELLVRNRGEA
jgi:2-C-methyl-D-erythritol 4-phosphate cytidylyltransferase